MACASLVYNGELASSRGVLREGESETDKIRRARLSLKKEKKKKNRGKPTTKRAAERELIITRGTRNYPSAWSICGREGPRAACASHTARGFTAFRSSSA